MTEPLMDYFDALDRLIKGRPIIVPKGIKITNDAVALEAGRGKGSIKKSRAVFKVLIDAIELAATEKACPQNEILNQLGSVKITAKKYRVLWEETLAREVSLLFELYELRKQIAELTAKHPMPENVLPIRRRKNDETKNGPLP